MRSINPAALLSIAYLAFGACAGQGGSGSSSPATASTPSPATPSTPSPALVKQNLVFTGPAAGTLTEAATLCRVYTAQTQINFTLTGKVAGQDMILSIVVYSGFKGPGTYQIGSTLDGSGELRLGIGSYAGASATGAGTLVIDSDGKSGSIDADVGGNEHIKGTFRCDQVRTD